MRHQAGTARLASAAGGTRTILGVSSRRMRTLIVALTFAWLAAALGCSDAAQQDCADCPIPDKQPACLEAAEDCQGIEGMDDQQQCLDEARALCESEP